MAKPKSERNMSALDYLYKKLYWLGNKIEALSRGKMSKRDLLIYSFIVIFIVSVYFGKIIGGFTFVLAVATIWNIWITRGLLKQSERVSRQSRDMFLADMVVRISQYISELSRREGLDTSEKLQDLVDELKILPYHEALEGALDSIDKELSKKFMDIWANFVVQYTKSYDRIYKKIKKKEYRMKAGVAANGKAKRKEDQE